MIKPLVAAVLAGVLLAGCGTQSAPSALQAWLRQSNLLSNNSALVSDARHAAAGLRHSSTSAPQLHTVCGVLLLETESVNASLPTPDNQLTKLLATAYNALGDGANECYRAGASVVARREALKYLQRGVAALAEARVRAILASTTT